MPAFERLLPLKTSYLSFPTDGEILGPQPSRNLLPTTEEHQGRAYLRLREQQKRIQERLSDARAEQRMMLDLFQAISKAERGEQFVAVKSQRRNAKDLVLRYSCPHAGCGKFYSAESALQRHIRCKHKNIKIDPPQPYHQLHPEPNLDCQIFESSEEDSASSLRRDRENVRQNQ